MKTEFYQKLAVIDQKLRDIENHRKLSDDLKWMYKSLAHSITALEAIATDKNGNLMNTYDGFMAQDVIDAIAKGFE